MDIISQIFKTIHFDANIYLHSEFCSPWGMQVSSPTLSSFHVIAYGNCTLETDHETIPLNSGDLIFFTRNIPHSIANQNDTEEISSTLICGKLEFGVDKNPILESLPDLIHIKASEIDKRPWLSSLFKQIVNEAESDSEGRQTILDKLAEILFLYVIRYYLTSDDDTANKQGLMAGLADPQLNKAILAMHQNISHPWTVESLAEQALMSRSAFSNKFHQLIGQTPMTYLTYWRLQCAYKALKGSQESILGIALSHGYQSEASFGKAFKKYYGISPGKVKKMAD